jgi:hypothetical protein
MLNVYYLIRIVCVYIYIYIDLRYFCKCYFKPGSPAIRRLLIIILSVMDQQLLQIFTENHRDTVLLLNMFIGF